MKTNVCVGRKGGFLGEHTQLAISECFSKSLFLNICCEHWIVPRTLLISPNSGSGSTRLHACIDSPSRLVQTSGSPPLPSEGNTQMTQDCVQYTVHTWESHSSSLFHTGKHSRIGNDNTHPHFLSPSSLTIGAVCMLKARPDLSCISRSGDHRVVLSVSCTWLHLMVAAGKCRAQITHLVVVCNYVQEYTLCLEPTTWIQVMRAQQGCPKTQ